MHSAKSKEESGAPLLAMLLGADLRSLALFRVATAVVVLIDLAVRASDLSVFYTDAGILPRPELLRTFAFLHAWPLCIHLLGGSWWTEVAVFTLAALSALALLVGYRTRLATILVWLFTMSVQLRNLYIGHGSDAQLRMILLWGCFLPLGARYSVDSTIRGSPPPNQQQYLSIATVALLAQIIIIYLSTGYAKMQYPWWRDGTAVGYVFDNEIWGTTAGGWMLQFPSLFTALTYATLFLELAGPFLLLVPIFFGPIRTLTLVALAAMHVGFGIGMRVGIFPFASVAALTALLPSWFWERVFAKWRTPERAAVRITFHANCRRCAQTLSLLRTFFLLPETHIGSSTRVGSSVWTVTDASGTDHVGSDAFLFLCRMSPLLWPLARLLAFSPLRRAVDAVWRRYAAHTADGTALPTTPPPQPISRHRLAEAVCGSFLAFVVFWNIGVLRDPTYTAPTWLTWFGETFFLQQDWRMYSRVATRTGWVVIPGTLKDGTQIDLFRIGGPLPDIDLSANHEPVSFERPQRVIYRVKNYRWLGMIDRLLHFKRGEQQLLLYGRYLCREWNAGHSGGEQLDTLEIIFMARDVHPESRTHRTEEYDKEVLWRHWCFGGPPATPS